MKARERVVVDTDALVSRLLLPHSTPGRAVRKAVDEARLLASDATVEEFVEVLSRRKFDPYVTVEERQGFLRLLGRIVEMVPVVHAVHECRDSRDDKFLELAINGAPGASTADCVARRLRSADARKPIVGCA